MTVQNQGCYLAVWVQYWSIFDLQLYTVCYRTCMNLYEVLYRFLQLAVWIPVQIGLHEAAALRPWMLVPEPLVALVVEERLTYIGVSKTNDHSRGLTVPVQKTEQVSTKVK
ncbi:Hypothetical_protein [Hexamita inflata]|uniref:Hypothetical_protein n=1 Tax=Hexamita inflata TaxID=28002 RepID=A0AA86TQQ0_9EUKA|nr:Hypothetical protein HINF_LOCUS12796 [Hexamita inflata]